MGDYFVDHVDLNEFKSIKYVNAQAIAKALLARFDDNEYDVATIFYSKFVMVVRQIPTAQQIIPAIFEDQSSASDTAVYDYEPDEETILADLLPRGVDPNICCSSENGASEQGARMSAMDNATRNAGDMIDKLTIEFNRSLSGRIITNELIEIISGRRSALKTGDRING